MTKLDLSKSNSVLSFTLRGGKLRLIDEASEMALRRDTGQKDGRSQACSRRRLEREDAARKEQGREEGLLRSA